jgi:uncharacterized damage-inducible protein DinB
MRELPRSFILGPPAEPVPASLAFLRQARFRLREDYWVKIKESLDLLDDQQVWWRPNEESNSIGNLVLHLSGNIRQWVVSGIDGATDIRDRSREFTERGLIGRTQLLDMLKATLDEVDSVMAGIEKDLHDLHSDAPLQRECIIQRYGQTVFDALFHVVEHFSYHTGQIVYLAKWQKSGMVRFYDDQQLMGRSS